MVEATLDEFGSIDVLVNNAGIARTAPAHEMSLETWNEVLQTNLTGVFLCTKHAGGTMVDGDGGTVINMASMSAFVANYPQEEVVYHASKGASSRSRGNSPRSGRNTVSGPTPWRRGTSERR